jgi:pepF/M3 family oligoendopeptidase
MRMSAPVWDLEALFEGTVHGAGFAAALAQLADDVEALIVRADALGPDDVDGRIALMVTLYEAAPRMARIRVCASGEANAHTDDKVAQRANARIGAIGGRISRAWVPINHHIQHCDQATFDALCAHPDAEPLCARMRNLRRGASMGFSQAEEALLAELGRDGIHAWSRHYDRISGRLQAQLGDGQVMSVGRAKNRLGHADRAVRADALRAINGAWGSVSEDCGVALSHIVGQRLTLNTRRGCDPVDDSLLRNRMQRSSLDAMLEASRQAGPLLERFMGLKARALGVPKLAFSDLAAPMGSTEAVSWSDARGFVLEHFGSYQPELANLAERAFDERWVEAQDRDHKRGGGYCASLGDGTSRIFMTFGSTWRSTTTLAHELGHAYHNWVLRDTHLARRFVPSTLAETASILAENLVRDAALANAPDDQSRLALLDARLSAGVSFMMNLPFRYDLERELYTMRAKGELDADVLRAASVRLQRKHYRDSLGEWFPNFWADKLHFYISHFAFYNYPYTFGYLFSSLVYQRVQQEGPGFHTQVVELLRRSGTEYAEPLAADVLGVDLSDPAVWATGWAGLEADLVAFERLVR